MACQALSSTKGSFARTQKFPKPLDLFIIFAPSALILSWLAQFLNANVGSAAQQLFQLFFGVDENHFFRHNGVKSFQERLDLFFYQFV